MCGIFALLNASGDDATLRRLVVELASRLRHRGPDWSSVWTDGRKNFLAHERLAIMDPRECGDQPMHNAEGTISWVVNGEIYNFEQLRDDHGLDCRTTSDSEVVGLLYEKYGSGFVSMLDGMFVFTIVDSRGEEPVYMAGRDHMGISPMYIGYGEDGSTWTASEMKCFQHVPGIKDYEIFPPGHFTLWRAGDKPEFTRWYEPRWVTDEAYLPSEPVDLGRVRETVKKAVLKRLMADVPYGVLLSGGLDSSLVTAIAAKHRDQAKNSLDWSEKLHTFSIGIEGAPDLQNARKVADFLGTEHHEFHFTPEEAIDAVPKVVYHLESWHQVRAAVPMFLLARKIKALGVKMVLSGEGADEALGGYLYFHEAPDAREFHRESVRKTTRLHQWDVLRANKATMANGLEARVPFLDKEVLDLLMTIDPSAKMCDMEAKPDGVHPKMEKYILRKAFDTPEDRYLPEEVLWRQKEQFSDGVGYDWVDGLKNYAEAIISDAEFSLRHERFPEETPQTKEYYFLRSMFEKHFPGERAVATIPDGRSVACSTPEALAWKPEWENQLQGDISGRAAGVHESSGEYYVAESEADANGVSALKRHSSTARTVMAGRTVAANSLPTRKVTKQVMRAARVARASRPLPGAGRRMSCRTSL
ncbi:asparagine synthase [Chloropicon primus]|uniref:Asparagine synthetase [glutamine-hydrolyzing] n=1 Tax=Chloropicon primus TaxID=1764295 RepID=A0A5B8MF63_9CHLO|nr:asparagine synthase [Chloropicon primus]UPQ98256.1 asparagine synthase [Chloropicon primus]|mmetsp:Transcript_4894/g.14665  ORF Transcript_4894/g.14665 Transcript_4894/m.14665 type:complete len:643 (-) Transcript_4894:75-2003(-)|eukprot:QDZ19047.1 asparagine synthase [Chloropicon primus]